MGNDSDRSLPGDDNERILIIDKCLAEFGIFANKRHKSRKFQTVLTRLKKDMKKRLDASKIVVDSDVIAKSKKVSKVEGKHSMGSIGYKVKDEQGNTIRRYVFDHKRGRTWRLK